MNQNKPKKVAIVYSGAKHPGGIETYLELLFENVDRAQIELTLLSLGEWPLALKLQAANYKLQIFSGSRFRPQTIWEIKKHLKSNNFDLIVSQGTVANAYARAASWTSGIPSLVAVHSVREFDYANPLLAGIYGLIERLTRFPTKRYIAVSEYLKKQLVKSGVKDQNISVIYNGVANNLKLEIRNSKLGKSQLVIGSVGRLHSTKGYHNLIQAFALLPTTGYKLLIHGEGDERKNLELLIKKLNLSERVKLRGYVDDVWSVFPEIDIYIQPSLMEGFGITVVEAMLAGKPVIVTPVGSLPELVKDGKTGIIAAGTTPEALAASLKLMGDNASLANKLAAAGRIDAEKRFSIQEWVQKTEKAFLEAK